MSGCAYDDATITTTHYAACSCGVACRIWLQVHRAGSFAGCPILDVLCQGWDSTTVSRLGFCLWCWKLDESNLAGEYDYGFFELLGRDLYYRRLGQPDQHRRLAIDAHLPHRKPGGCPSLSPEPVERILLRCGGKPGAEYKLPDRHIHTDL